MLFKDLEEAIAEYSSLDFSRLNITDQMALLMALNNFLTSIKPIMDKYYVKPEAGVENSIQKFFDNISRGGKVND